MGAPVIGGLIDSVIGIITGAVFGIAPQLAALLHSLGPPRLSTAARRRLS